MTPFLSVLAWLASATGDEAKAGEAREFRFEPPAKVDDGALASFFESDVGIDVLGRLCCALGDSDVLDFAEIGPHHYRKKAPDSNLLTRVGEEGGRHGFLYTRHGGFIDLGHVRDYIDYTRFFAARYYSAPSSGRTGNLSKVFEEEGEIHLEIVRRTEKPSLTLAAAMGAKLAYERAIWHEIVTYFPPTSIVDERFSSFAPEDCFSNAIGVLAGYRALLTATRDTPFDVAAQRALHKILAQLGPVPRPEDTQAAIDFVKGHWWVASLTGGPPAKRRNFNAFSPVSPWLVTDIEIPGKEDDGDELRATLARPKPARVHLPVDHAGQPLDGLAHFEMTNFHPALRTLLPSLPIIRGSDLPAVVAAIRAEERRVNGADADSPGPPVP